MLLSGRSFLRRIASAMGRAAQVPALSGGGAAQEAEGHPALALVSRGNQVQLSFKGKTMLSSKYESKSVLNMCLEPFECGISCAFTV